MYSPDFFGRFPFGTFDGGRVTTLKAPGGGTPGSGIKTIDVVTRGDRLLAEAGGTRGGTWSRDGVIVFVPSAAC